MSYEIVRDDNDAWRALHKGRLFALAGLYCHLMFITRRWEDHP